MRFLDVKTDYAFKKVFGSEESKDILISFLNSIVEFENNLQIKDLDILDPYNMPMLHGVKATYVDIKAKLDDDSLVIIEMQVVNQSDFQKRVLYNAAKNYSLQLKKGESYHLLNPVIALSILDFEMFKDSDKMITNFKLLEKEDFTLYSDDIELIFVELPKFNKLFEECKDIKDKWIYFIKNAGNLEVMPKNIPNEQKQAYEIINQANLTEEELEFQRKRVDFVNMVKGAEQFSFDKGEKKGIEKGIEKERLNSEKKIASEKLNLAKNLLDILDDETIALKTGLDIAAVASLRL